MGKKEYTSDDLPPEELVAKFEAAIHKFAQGKIIEGMGYEDLVQEFKVTALHAASKYDHTKGFLFWTFLMRCLHNRWCDMIDEACRKHLDSSPIEDANENMLPTYDEDDDSVELISLIGGLSLNLAELFILDLRLCGYKKGEIQSLFPDGKVYYKALAGLKEKAGTLTIN